jgi:hypothetical protein
LPRPPWLRPLGARLVIAVSAVVAVATSAPPTWSSTDSSELVVALGDSPRQVTVTLDLAGELYADARGGDMVVTVIADRAASDLTLSLRRLTPRVGASADAAEPEAPADFLGSAELDGGAEPDGGAVPDGGAAADGRASALTAHPSLEEPNRAALSLSIDCVETYGDERAEACREVFQVELAKASERPLNVTLRVDVVLDGNRERRPSGTVAIDIAEVAP